LELTCTEREKGKRIQKAATVGKERQAVRLELLLGIVLLALGHVSIETTQNKYRHGRRENEKTKI
jgi:hypothetical protein